MSQSVFGALFSAPLAHADGVIVRLFPLGASEIADAPRLKVIAKHGVGVDNIDVAAATARRIPVVITPTANANSVAEHTVALMLALARHLYPAAAATFAGRFHERNKIEGIELAGRTLGLVGLGRIGGRVAHIARHGLTMDVLAYDPEIADLIAKEFSACTGRIVPAHLLVAKLTALRKRGLLPKVEDRPKRDEDTGFMDIDDVGT